MGGVKVAGILVGVTLRDAISRRRRPTNRLRTMANIKGVHRISGIPVMNIRMDKSCAAEGDRDRQDNLEQQGAHDLRIGALGD